MGVSAGPWGMKSLLGRGSPYRMRSGCSTPLSPRSAMPHRSPLRLAAVLLALAPGATPARPAGPVEELARELSNPPDLRSERDGQAAVTAWRARLRKRADAVVRVGDLRQALFLPHWSEQPRHPELPRVAAP